MPKRYKHRVEPIVFRATVDVRFADLDSYGHVNSAHYLDYVVTSRWRFMKERFDVTEKTYQERRVGFVLSRAETRFRKPIASVGPVLVTSKAESLSGFRLNVSYRISSPDEATLFADGTLDVVSIDLDTQRLTPCPAWVRALLFETPATENS